MNLWRGSSFLLCLFALLPAFAQESLYHVTPRSAPIWGSPIDFRSLRGKVVMVEYWGINCGPCIASFPKLVECQSRYGSTGQFVLIGSHMQGMSERVMPFLKEKTCNFTVYQGMSFPGDGKTGGGIPYAFLYNHEGKLVASGSPTSVIAKVEPYIEQARMAASLLSYDFIPCAGLTLEGPFQQLPQLFPRDKSWSAAMKKVEKLGKSQGKKEGNATAAALFEQMNAAIDREVEELLRLRDEHPVRAFYRLQRLNKNLSGMSQATAVKDALAEIRKDKDVQELQKIWQDGAKLLDAKTQGIPAKKQLAAQKTAASLLKRLETFCQSDGRSSATVSEAQDLVKRIRTAFSVES